MSIPPPKTHSSVSGLISPTALRPAIKRGTSSSRPTSPVPTPQLVLSPPVGASSLPPSHSDSFTDDDGTRQLRTPSNAGGYTTKVSFDTFAGPPEADSLFSFTLQVKSDGYRKTRNTRIYLCAASNDESGQQALEWSIENLIEDGDELVVVRGFDSDDLKKDMHDQVREEAKDLMKVILEKNSEFDNRRVSIVVEFVAGKVTDTLDRMTALYRPDSLVVGTRGSRSLMQTWGAALGAPGMGSVSRYCVSHSPVPVIVVKPEGRIRKTIEKRRADPKRKAQFEELIKTRSYVGSSQSRA